MEIGGREPHSNPATATTCARKSKFSEVGVGKVWEYVLVLLPLSPRIPRIDALLELCHVLWIGHLSLRPLPYRPSDLVDNRPSGAQIPARLTYDNRFYLKRDGNVKGGRKTLPNGELNTPG